MANTDQGNTAEGRSAGEGSRDPGCSAAAARFSGAAVKKMIKQAKKRGYVTYEQLNAVMPSEEVTSEQIEDILAMLNEMGINVVETEEDEAEEEEPREEDEDEEIELAELVEVIPKTPAKSKPKEPVERTDDPVRLYLREMGSIGLLSRQGEAAIAKRIEAGLEAMIAGLCESPLTFQAVIIWRDELNDRKLSLRDIIDLEATYAGPDVKAVSAAMPGVDAPPAAPARAPPFLPVVSPQPVAPPSAPPAPTPFEPKPLNGDGEEQTEEGARGESDLDADDLENSMSLAASLRFRENGILPAETKAPEKRPRIRMPSAETTRTHPANSGQFAMNREISVCVTESRINATFRFSRALHVVLTADI